MYYNRCVTKEENEEEQVHLRGCILIGWNKKEFTKEKEGANNELQIKIKVTGGSLVDEMIKEGLSQNVHLRVLE